MVGQSLGWTGPNGFGEVTPGHLWSGLHNCSTLNQLSESPLVMHNYRGIITNIVEENLRLLCSRKSERGLRRVGVVTVATCKGVGQHDKTNLNDG